MIPQTCDKRSLICRPADSTRGLADHLRLIADQTRHVPSVEDTSCDGWHSGMADGELFGEINGVTDQLIASFKNADGGFLTGIGGVTAQFAKYDEIAKVVFEETHEMRVDVEPVRIARVLVNEPCPDETDPVRQQIGAAFEPSGACWMRVRIQQNDVPVSCQSHPRFGSLAVTMRLLPPPLPAHQHTHIRLLAQPGERAIRAAAVDDDDFIASRANRRAHPFHEQTDEQVTIGGDGDDADRRRAIAGGFCAHAASG